MKKDGITIEINGAGLLELIESKGQSMRAVDAALGYGKDYMRGCIKRNRMDENRFIDILRHLGTTREKAELETIYDLSDVPTWQILAEAKRR